ncbi:MAG TPA: DUF3048 domain-containing protein [Candidatus Fimivivens sp.]|nr:DUF3048 domain-containing protein [Candidatus Fimivivens sp.]
MDKRQKVVVAVLAVLVALAIAYFTVGRDYLRRSNVSKIQVGNESAQPTGPLNQGNVSPISGLACDNWNRRPFAFMQPVDIQARPVAGFSQADMVFEMPNPAEGIFVTRLMGVYLCNIPTEIGALRSARHDYIAIAKGLDAVFVGWGGSAFAIQKLNEGVIDNIDCNGQGGKKAPQCCFRKERTGLMRVEDTGFAKGDAILSCAKEFGYRSETTFSGYPHQADAAESDRPTGGYLRVAYPGMMKAEYNYDKASNSYLRIWGGTVDTDRNNGQRIAPKNIVVMTAENEQIMADVNYTSRGVQDPWANLPEGEKTGPTNISGRYNNLQIGDPWFDGTDSGSARFFLNGKEIDGTWKKSKSKADAKLTFYDNAGQEVKFVPGQIWVEVVIPGMVVEWTPQA